MYTNSLFIKILFFLTHTHTKGKIGPYLYSSHLFKFWGREFKLIFSAQNPRATIIAFHSFLY